MRSIHRYVHLVKNQKVGGRYVISLGRYIYGLTASRIVPNLKASFVIFKFLQHFHYEMTIENSDLIANVNFLVYN